MAVLPDAFGGQSCGSHGHKCFGETSESSVGIYQSESPFLIPGGFFSFFQGILC